MVSLFVCAQVRGVLDAMPSTNLKPEQEDEELEENRVYRTTYMFSATMPPAVERLARKYMRRPVVINIGSAGKATDSVTQASPTPFRFSVTFPLPASLVLIAGSACLILLASNGLSWRLQVSQPWDVCLGF